MKKFIQKMLANKAKKFVLKHKPIIIAVTGSVGKTSTRNAIATVLSKKYKVAKTLDNYNNEFGVPLAILGVKSPGKSIMGWLSILMSQPKEIPQVYVLEYAIDHPGDMKYLCDIAKPSIGVMTAISPVHVEFFRSVEQLVEEKAYLLESVSDDGLAVVNADDPKVIGLKGHLKSPTVSFGFSDKADMRAVYYDLETRNDYSFEPGEKFSEVGITVRSPKNESIEMKLPNFLGKAAVNSVLAACTVARHLDVSWDEIVERIPAIKHEPGRMNPIPGIKGSLILDSSYNAAPASMKAALDVLAEFNPAEDAHKIAVLGHMAELGPMTEDEHRMVGMHAQETGVDVLVTVGETARGIREGAMDAGVQEEDTIHFKDSVSAGRWLDTNIKKGDVVLVKGSQSARMEKVVKDVMAEPVRAGELLVRQSEKWITQ
jgi:UDP-N-acetylmuramoyl-tripeptide--D-alanyl-D-alanine ligase